MLAMHESLWFRTAAILVALHTFGCGDKNDLRQVEDPAACDCPLEWDVDNITICGVESSSDPVRAPLLYSTSMSAACENYGDTFPQPVPRTPWSKQRIRSTCAGSGELCVTLKQGDWEHPGADDCVLARKCTPFTYNGENKVLELPPIEAWSVTDSACAYKFEANDGYLEFENDSQLGCTPVEQKRVCPLSCARDHSTAECQACLREVEGTFSSSD
jgi:hypothetical protein